eukprot:SAG22_NODE_14093_length_384_cov_3.564912_2_plen_47_part_01
MGKVDFHESNYHDCTRLKNTLIQYQYIYLYLNLGMQNFDASAPIDRP